MTPLETLKAARQLISDPAKWTHAEVLALFDAAIAELEGV